MEQQHSDVHFASAGFWLPCYQSSFFSSKDDGAVLRSSYEFSEADLGPFADRNRIKLDANIFSRLLMVLPRKGYSDAFPIFPGHGSIDDTKPLPNPVAILFLAKDFANLPGAATEAKWHPASIQHGVFEVSLVVNRHGFYIWTVAYRGKENRAHDVHVALKEHIAALVGGAFASKHSGRAGTGRSGSGKQITEDDVPAENLRQYRDNDVGFLTFFQINTLLEGLRNVNLDPRMFFRTDQIESEYAIGSFVQELTATIRPYHSAGVLRNAAQEDTSVQDVDGQQRHSGESRVTIREFFRAYLREPESLRTPDRHFVTKFAKQVTYPHAQAMVLDQFLATTEALTLKVLKKRIERCRRALLDELIEVTHRRDPLVQAEPPDGPVDRIEDVSEAQLRGYVMLIAAKLPLISNVLLHLEDLHYDSQTNRATNKNPRVLDDSSIADPETESSEVFGPFHSWTGLLHAIQNDLQSLTEAINQARTDRMLYEQEQIHAEQETLAEITRLRERTDDSIGGGASATISVVSNLLALIAVLLALGTVFQNGQLNTLAQEFFSNFNLNNVPGAVEITIGIISLIIVYLAISVVASTTIRWITRVIRRDLRLESKFYYELDAHVDAPFKAETLTSLLHEGIPVLPVSLSPFRAVMHGAHVLFYKLQRAFLYFEHAKLPEITDDNFRHFVTKYERNSYRVERLEKSEALHKIYIEAALRVNTHRIIRAVIVYEILYHRPAKDHDFIFKDLRVVSTHAYELTLDEIVNLKQILARFFLNPCLEKGWALVLPPKGDGYDALFTVTEQAILTDENAGSVRPSRNRMRLGWAFTWPRWILWGR